MKQRSSIVSRQALSKNPTPPPHTILSPMPDRAKTKRLPTSMTRSKTGIDLPLEYSFELSQRIKAGLARAREAGRMPGPKPSYDAKKIAPEIMGYRSEGLSIREIASKMGIKKSAVERTLKLRGGFGSFVIKREMEKTKFVLSELKKEIKGVHDGHKEHSGVASNVAEND